MKDKKIKIFVFAFLAVILSTVFIFVINAATNISASAIITAVGNGTDITNSNKVTKDTAIPEKYSFSMEYSTDDNLAIISGGVNVPDRVANAWGANDESQQKSWYTAGVDTSNKPSLAVDSIKNNYSIRYNKVGVYKGKTVDLKVTVVDFETTPNPENISDREPVISFSNLDGTIAASVLDVKWLQLKLDFYETGTTTPITVAGNVTYWDVDNDQGVVLDNNNKGIYATRSSQLKISTISGDNYVFDASHQNSGTSIGDDESLGYAFSEVFEGASITRIFTFGTPVSNNWGSPRTARGGIAFFSQSVTGTKLPEPVKKVSTTTPTVGQEYTYTITQQIPNSIESYYYSSFNIKDTFESVITPNTNGITIVNEKGTNVKDNFNISKSGNIVTIAAKASYLSSDAFYGHTYTIRIPASINSGANLTSYKSDNTYKIPNKAISTTDKYEVESEIVYVTPNVPINIKYNIVSTDNPPASTISINKDKPDDITGRYKELDTYTAEPVLTTTWKKKKCSFNGWSTNNSLSSKFTTGQITHNLVTNSVFNLYGGWNCEELVKKPAKSVNNKDSIVVDNDERFNFTITHEVPNITDSNYYYDKYVFTDQIDSALKIREVDIVDKNGKDVTDNFSILINNSIITITAKNTSSADFYNQIYSYTIVANKKDGVDLGSYYNAATKEYEIPNKAKIEVNDATIDKTIIETNEVTVKVKQYDIKYHVIGETIPDPSKTDPTPADKKVFSGAQYTQEGKLTTRVTDKVCSFNGWYLDEAFTNKWNNGDQVLSNLDFYGSWTCDNIVGDINKTITDDKIKGTREFDYTIYQIVPNASAENYYQSYSIEDELEEVLEIKDTSKVKVLNGETDVTNKFTVEIDGNKVTITAKDTTQADFYNKEYAFVLTVNRNKNVALDKYLKGDKYIIPNKAKLIVKRGDGEVEEKISKEVEAEIYRARVDYEIVGTDRPDPNLTDPLPQSVTLLTGEKYKAEALLTTRDETKQCTFKGWYIDDQLDSKYVDNSEIEDDITLYGSWNCVPINEVVNVPPTAASARRLVISGVAILALAGGGYYFLLRKNKVKNEK